MKVVALRILRALNSLKILTAGRNKERTIIQLPFKYVFLSGEIESSIRKSKINIIQINVVSFCKVGERPEANSMIIRMSHKTDNKTRGKSKRESI